MEYWEKRSKITKIVEDNIEQIPYEGSEVDIDGIVSDMMEFIEDLEKPVKK